MEMPVIVMLSLRVIYLLHSELYCHPVATSGRKEGNTCCFFDLRAWCPWLLGAAVFIVGSIVLTWTKKNTGKPVMPLIRLLYAYYLYYWFSRHFYQKGLWILNIFLHPTIYIYARSSGRHEGAVLDALVKDAQSYVEIMRMQPQNHVIGCWTLSPLDFPPLNDDKYNQQ